MNARVKSEKSKPSAKQRKRYAKKGNNLLKNIVGTIFDMSRLEIKRDENI